MPNVLFVDNVCPAPYDPQVLAARGLGGSEATVVRVAESLGRRFALEGRGIVAVGQHNRRDVLVQNAVYEPLPSVSSKAEWDVVVAFRSPTLLVPINNRFPRARLVLWLQDLADPRLFHPAIAAVQPLIVTASEFHTRDVSVMASYDRCRTMPRIVHIFNPIDDHLVATDAPVDPNKLIFFSSPNKGLERTIEVFLEARRVNPAFELFISNPGYRDWNSTRPLPPGLHDLGSLPHATVLEHVRQSLCVLCLNDIYPETFGCVLAEANAVGTPALAHPIGAAPEVLTEPGQLINVRDSRAVVERLIAWRDGGRPRVYADERFRLASVTHRWETVLTHRPLRGAGRDGLDLDLLQLPK